jgi:hypothetical protein
VLRSLEVVRGGILTDGSGDAFDWVRAEIRALLRRGEIDRALLSRLSASNPLLAEPSIAFDARLGAARSESVWSARLRDPKTNTSIKVLSGRSERKQRYYDKALLKHFEGKVEIVQATNADRVEQFILDAAGIGDQTYQYAIGVGVRNDRRWRQMLDHLAASKRLHAFTLVAAGCPIAYLLAASEERRVVLLAQSYLPQHRELRPGNFLLRRVLEQVADEGFEYFDFGYGDGQQKSSYGTEVEEEITIALYSKRARATLVWALETLVGRVHEQTKTLLLRMGWLEVLRRRWRAVLERRVGSNSPSLPPEH